MAVKKPTKLLGSVAWCVLGENYQGKIEQGLLREGGGELSIDVECNGRRYNAKLRRRSGDSFDGAWTRHGTTTTGTVTATMYHSSEGDLLFGEWFEEHTKYQWWAHLRRVDRFPHEESQTVSN
jgi:hypothetical protein